MKKFGNLTVTAVLLSQSQTCLWREERRQSLVLVALKDEKTGETGHLVYELEVDRRYTKHEGVYTDNPKLFQNEHPEADQLQELFAHADDSTPKERNKEIDELLAACWHPVSYEERDGVWGLYADE
jgi:hypothetical protein